MPAVCPVLSPTRRGPVGGNTVLGPYHYLNSAFTEGLLGALRLVVAFGAACRHFSVSSLGTGVAADGPSRQTSPPQQLRMQ